MILKTRNRILALNVGSTSIKSRVFVVNKNGITELLAWSRSNINSDKEREKTFKELRKLLEDKKLLDKIMAVGHRVVHGGPLKKSVNITSNVIEIIKKYRELAPLHNPYNLEGIAEAKKWFGKNIPQIAVFDTAFFAKLPDYASNYAIPRKYAVKYNLYRYGFHGISHNYSMLEAAKILKKPVSKLKLITVHLGGGSSITAINHGVAVDTSMGFTPLEGLVMGTRSGDIDPGIIFYLAEKEKLTLKKVKDILEHESGTHGISGTANMLELLAKMRRKDSGARLAFEMFAYRIKKYIGAYAAILGGCNAVVFTGAIGSGDNITKNKVVRSLQSFTLKKSKILSVKPNEEKMIALETQKILNFEY